MKRMLLSLLMAVVCSGLFAQSVDKAKDLLKANKFVEAKDEIDKALLVEKNQKNAEAWYVKVKIYDTIGTNAQLKAQYPDALVQSLDALKNYIKYDDKKQVLIIADGYKPLNVIYPGLFQAGVSNYEAKNYSQALLYFSNAVSAIDICIRMDGSSRVWILLPCCMRVFLQKKIISGMKRQSIIKRLLIPESPRSAETIWPKYINGLQIIIPGRTIKQTQLNILPWANPNIQMICFMMNCHWMN